MEIHDVTPPEQTERFVELQENDELTCRVWMRPDLSRAPEMKEKGLHRGLHPKTKKPDPWLRYGALKGYLDGLVEGHPDFGRMVVAQEEPSGLSPAHLARLSVSHDLFGRDDRRRRAARSADSWPASLPSRCCGTGPPGEKRRRGGSGKGAARARPGAPIWHHRRQGDGPWVPC